MARRSKVIHKYYEHESMADTACFYCGAHGESKDHVPAISSPYEYEEEKRLLVRSCILCNSLLGNKKLLTLLSRCDYLLIKYQHRFKKLLGMPHWEEYEIEELEGKLKRSIILSLKQKKYVISKIQFIEENIRILQGY